MTYAETRHEALRRLRNEGYAVVDREGYEALRREVEELREVTTDPVAIANILLDVRGVYAHNDKWIEDDGTQLPAAIAIPRNLARELFFSREPRQPCPDCAGTGAENRVTGKGPCVVCGGTGVVKIGAEDLQAHDWWRQAVGGQPEVPPGDRPDWCYACRGLCHEDSHG